MTQVSLKQGVTELRAANVKANNQETFPASESNLRADYRNLLKKLLLLGRFDSRPYKSPFNYTGKYLVLAGEGLADLRINHFPPSDVPVIMSAIK